VNQLNHLDSTVKSFAYLIWWKIKCRLERQDQITWNNVFGLPAICSPKT
jgi:hypothetical protein